MKFSKILSLFLVLTMIMTPIFPVFSDETTALQTDYSDSLEFNVSIKKSGDDGEVTASESTEPIKLKTGDKLRVTFKWALDISGITVNNGDYAAIPFDFGEILNVQNIAQSAEIRAELAEQGSVLIGTMDLSSSGIKINFSDLSGQNLSVVRGEVGVDFSASKPGNTAINGINVTVIEKESSSDEGSGGNSGNSGGNASDNPKILGKTPIQEKDLEFSKNGKQYYKHESDRDPSVKNKIYWNMRVGYGQYKNFFENSASTETWSDVLLVDTLPSGLEFSNIKFSTTVYAPVASDVSKMSDSGVFDTLEFRDFETLNKFDGESYDDFVTRIKNNGKITVGYYEDKMLIAFGDMPGDSMPTFHSLFGGKDKFEAEVNKRIGNEITQSQADAVIAYCGENGPTNGKITAFNISYHTEVINGLSGRYTNMAELSYNSASENTSHTVDFIGFYMSASADSAAATTITTTTTAETTTTTATTASSETTTTTAADTSTTTTAVTETTMTSASTSAEVTATTTSTESPTPISNTTPIGYIELDENGVPLYGVTTTPKSEEFGGTPTSDELIDLDIKVPLSSLPYTAQTNSEVYIGIGILTIALGVVFKRALK